MPQIPYRSNLSSAIFPMTLAKSGRSVINPGMDQNFDKRVDPGASPGSVGIPQMIYCENVLPTPEGFQSLGFKTTGNITIGSGINTVETIRLATEIDESTVTPDTDSLDEGDQLGTWTVSPNDTGGLDFREVTQDATIGDPVDSYRFQYDRNEQIPAYMFKNYGIGNTDDLELTFDFRISGADLFKQVYVKFLNTGGGAGPGIYITHDPAVDPDNDSILIQMGSSWSAVYGMSTLSGTNLTELLEDEIWYTCNVHMYQNPDNTYTIQATLERQDDPGVFIGTVNYTGSFISGTNLGGYIGVVQETGNASGGERFYTHYDNIHVVASAPDISYTSVTGITNIDVAFRGDNTIKWSHGNVDTFENLDGTLPVGFESPADTDKFSWTLTRGQCFVCIKNADDSTHIYRVTYDDLGPTLEFTEVTEDIDESLGEAFNINSVDGIGGSYNYLLLFTPDSVAWSSTTNLLDFTPSLVSGAGSERVSDLKGDIKFIRQHVSGYFLYTTGNAVFASYTGNSRYPWKFREVGGSNGYTHPQQVAGDTNAPIQYGISNTRNIQALQPSGAELIAQEATNFFERSTSWDIYISPNFELRRQPTDGYLLPASGKYRVWIALNRYIILGYYDTASESVPALFQNALVYDVLEKRYGKTLFPFNTLLISEKAIYFVRYSDGGKTKWVFDINDADVTTVSRMLIGKFCLARDHMIDLEQVILESGNDVGDATTSSYSVKLLPTYDGKTFLPAVTPVLDPTRSTNLIRTYNCRLTAQNISALIEGKFDLANVELKAVDGGRR